MTDPRAGTTMDWTYPAGSGDAGIFEIGRRLAEALGRGPDATRFTYDPMGMLRSTREIEAAARGGRLLTGFQTAAKLADEAARYADLLAAGTTVSVWATGAQPDLPGLDGLDYHQVPPDTRELVNQWFLVTDAPEPVAFVSYELSNADRFGVGGAGNEDKRFVGFVSDDQGVVALLMAALTAGPAAPAPPSDEAGAAPAAGGGAAPSGSAPGTGTATRPVSDAVAEIIRRSDPTGAVASGAAAGAVVVALGRGDALSAFLTAFAMARREERALVLVDRSAEGFVSPYKDWRGDDDVRPNPDQLFDAGLARREGRPDIGRYLDAAAAAGVSAGAWFPTRAGSDGLAEAARRFSGSVFVLPPDLARPTLAERLRGMSTGALAKATGLPVLIAGAAA